MLGRGGFAREVFDTIDIINTHTDEATSPRPVLYIMTPETTSES